MCHCDTRLPVVADKHWHLQIRHYAANTLLASLKFIHSNLQLDDLADPFSIGNTCAKHFKTDRRSVVSFWMTYKNDVVVGIKRKRSNVQDSYLVGKSLPLQRNQNSLKQLGL